MYWTLLHHEHEYQYQERSWPSLFHQDFTARFRVHHFYMLRGVELDKVVLSIRCSGSDDLFVKSFVLLGLLSGQRPQVILSKTSVARYRLRQGDIQEVKVTLRGAFLHRFVHFRVREGLPSVRDFEPFQKSTSNDTISFAWNFTFPLEAFFQTRDYFKHEKHDRARPRRHVQFVCGFLDEVATCSWSKHLQKDRFHWTIHWLSWVEGSLLSLQDLKDKLLAQSKQSAQLKQTQQSKQIHQSKETKQTKEIRQTRQTRQTKGETKSDTKRNTKSDTKRNTTLALVAPTIPIGLHLTSKHPTEFEFQQSESVVVEQCRSFVKRCQRRTQTVRSFYLPVLTSFIEDQISTIVGSLRACSNVVSSKDLETSLNPFSSVALKELERNFFAL